MTLIRVLDRQVVAYPAVDVINQPCRAFLVAPRKRGGELVGQAAALGTQEECVDHYKEDAAAETRYRAEDARQHFPQVELGDGGGADVLPAREGFDPEEIGEFRRHFLEICLVGRSFNDKLIDGPGHDEAKPGDTKSEGDEYERPPNRRRQTAGQGEPAHRVGRRVQHVDRDDRREDRQDEALADNEKPAGQERKHHCPVKRGETAFILSHGAPFPQTLRGSQMARGIAIPGNPSTIYLTRFEVYVNGEVLRAMGLPASRHRRSSKPICLSVHHRTAASTSGNIAARNSHIE